MSEAAKEQRPAPLVLRSLRQTQHGTFFSEWVGETIDGLALYVRCKHGWLEAWTGPTLYDATVADEPVFARRYDGKAEHNMGMGEMTTEEMLTHTRFVVVR
ncbi:MAG: hypothetical protein AB1760_00240 [Pseudomonadota bacterium]